MILSHQRQPDDCIAALFRLQALRFGLPGKRDFSRILFPQPHNIYYEFIMKHLRNIRRMDDDARRTHAWIVQVQRKNNITIKMFSDSLFGGKQKALVAAVEYRDFLTMAPSPAEHNLWHRTIVRRNNTSGVPGVGLFSRKNGNDRWVAYWIDENGIKKSRSFSVGIYGQRQAKQLAIVERQRQLKRLYKLKSEKQPPPSSK